MRKYILGFIGIFIFSVLVSQCVASSWGAGGSFSIPDNDLIVRVGENELIVNNDINLEAASLNYGLLSLPFLSQFPTKQGEMLSVTGAMLLNNGFMTNDGDGLVPTYSAKGDGVAHLKNQRGEGLGLKDLKTFDYKFDGTHATELIASMLAINSSLGWMWAQDITGFTETAFMWGMTAGIVGANYGAFVDIKDNYMAGHGLMLKKVCETKIIDHALEDCVNLDGKTNTTASRSGISASSINTPTAGFDAPEQAFVLLFDLDGNKNPSGVYHTVTIEGVQVSRHQGVEG